MRKGKDFRSLTVDGHLEDDGEYDIPENYEDVKELLLTLIGKTNHMADPTLSTNYFREYIYCLQKEIEMLCAVEEHIDPSPTPYR